MPFAPTGPRWSHEGRDWPHRAASAFIAADGPRWHVQRFGDGPPLLLLHGAGGATHSFSALAPLLAQGRSVIVPDLPGHGFTPVMGRPNLPNMARAVAALLNAMKSAPTAIIGHSAGAAIALRMTLDGLVAPDRLISLNGALFPFGGLAGQLFPPLARVMFLNPMTPQLFSWTASDRRRVEKLIRDIGSTIPATQIDRYHQLFRAPGHVYGALAMMAHWDLDPLIRDLPALQTPLLHVVGERDRAVPPADGARLAQIVPMAEIHRLPNRGHLAHEEDAAETAAVIQGFLDARDDAVIV